MGDSCTERVTGNRRLALRRARRASDGVSNLGAMADDPGLIWDRRPKPPVRPARPAPATEPPLGGRISLREAEHRFGVTASTLRGWARRATIDAVLADGPGGRRWMVTPESVAHHLAHGARDGAPARPAAPRGRDATGPSTDGSAMLVPRDAWDRLMDQLGNLHEAGLQLAEARERAAKAETEASFLRERLGEIRSERDELKKKVEAAPVTAPAITPKPATHPTTWDALKRWWSR